VQKSLLLLSENETRFLALPFRSLTSALIILPLPDRDICKRRLHLKSRNSSFLSYGELYVTVLKPSGIKLFNPLKAELNPICHLLALLEAHHILHVSRIRVNPY